jgi:hypothetical protein
VLALVTSGHVVLWVVAGLQSLPQILKNINFALNLNGGINFFEIPSLFFKESNGNFVIL